MTLASSRERTLRGVVSVAMPVKAPSHLSPGSIPNTVGHGALHANRYRLLLAKALGRKHPQLRMATNQAFELTVTHKVPSPSLQRAAAQRGR